MASPQQVRLHVRVDLRAEPTHWCNAHAMRKTIGPYPGDGPYQSAAAAFVNKGLVVSNNLIYDMGKRVGHGAGVWFFQTGESTVVHNYIKEVPRNAVGMYGIRFGAGAGFGSGVLPASLYGETLDFWSAVTAMTTRNNTVAYNQARCQSYDRSFVSPPMDFGIMICRSRMLCVIPATRAHSKRGVLA